MAYGNLASKGRYGDTEIRNVAGRKSHVNKTEASLIDALGRKGEALTQALGSGTRNPMTGMPEYNWWKKQKKKAKKWWNKKVKPIGKMNVPEAGIYAGTGGLGAVVVKGQEQLITMYLAVIRILVLLLLLMTLILALQILDKW